MPTRLLDWTENPLVALWFALYKEKDNGDNSDRVVWRFIVKHDEIVNPKQKVALRTSYQEMETTGSIAKLIEATPFNQKSIKIFRPNHISKRITAQNGWFTIHYFDNEFKWCSPLENEKKANKKLFKFKMIISEDLRNEFLKRLDIMGINSFSLFPDFEGLGNYLQWKYLAINNNNNF